MHNIKTLELNKTKTVNRENIVIDENLEISTTKMELEVNESTGKFYIHNKSNNNINGKTNNNNNSHIIHSDCIEQTTATNTLVSSIKSFVSNIFIKPIIDMTSMIVGSDLTDNNHHHETTSLSMSLKSMLWNETTTTDCGGVVINGNNNGGIGNTTMNGSSPTKSPPTIYLDNHSSDRIFISSCEKSVVLMNFYQQDTFFDCDDYIDGGEDTIDFVADSTKIQYNSFGHELLPTKHFKDSPKNYSSALSTFKKSPELLINDVNLRTEQPIPSPELIPYGCIFTQFFRLDNSKDSKEKSPLLAMCYKQHKARQLQQINITTSKERPSMSSSSSSSSMSPCRRTSEIESDDSFIVFEESPKSTKSVDDLIITKPTTLLKNYNNRQRQLSECSDDLILFEGDPDDDTTDEDFTDSTDDSDSEDESDIESDCLDYTAILNDVENKDQPDSGFEENKDQDSGPEDKKVTFNLCPTVHEIRAWNFAYSEARKGKWEQMGRDRERFEKRIKELSHILSPILKADHRQKIYKQRFNDEHVNHNTKHRTQHISNKRKKIRK